MPFQQKGFWNRRDAGCLADGQMDYENSSRIELKRGHQWFMDANRSEVLNNKKQAIEGVNSRAVSGISHMNVSPGHSTSNFPSGFAQFADRQFESEPVTTVNLVDRSISSFEGGSSNMTRKDLQDHYNSSMGFSTSHFIEGPSSFINGGFRKVIANQIRDSANGISASMGLLYSRGGNDTISMGTTYKGDNNNNISLGSTNNNLDENVLSMGLAYRKDESSLISMNQAFNKEDENCMSMGCNYSIRNDITLPMGRSFLKGDANLVSTGQFSEKGDSNILSLGSYHNKGHENFFSAGLPFNRVNESLLSMGSSYDKGSNNVIAAAPTYDKADSNLTSTGSTHDKGDSGVVSVGHNYNKGECGTTSFAGFQHETEAGRSGHIIGDYDLLMTAQNSAQASEKPSQMDLVESSVDPIFSITPETNPKVDVVRKNKEPKTVKKAPANNFPSNVKSLLSTGMFDGVPVKYVSWSREKNLKGAIKGSGYLCGCSDCNYEKTLNAFEFECHAKCKTKHPNNHIYFENGKTIYGIVQELKNTPPEKLFDAIQAVTGSLLNQKNFRIWKGNAASYQLATRELQRIYGKDEIALPS